MKNLPFLLLAVLLSGCGEPIQDDIFPVLTGDYFGQTLPGETPELFAPGWITTGLLTRDVTMTPDGREIYFCAGAGGYGYTAIMCTRLENGRWTRPEVTPFSSNPAWLDLEPCISADGQRFFFLSNRPIGDGEPGNSDIWVMDREGDQWGAPWNLGPPVNTPGQEFYPSLTRDGTLYFTRSDERGLHTIHRSRLVDGRYQEPELLPEQVNCGRNRFNAFVSPDESFVIVPTVGMPDSRGGVDYYITFRYGNDRWSEPQNMGDQVNSSDGSEWSASTSPDGRYLFFMSARQPDLDAQAPVDYARMRRLHDSPQNGSPDIYWCSTAVIDRLRASALSAKEAGDE